MEEASYSPSGHSSDSAPEHEISHVSLRSISSQMSISSVASTAQTIHEKRRHRVFGAKKTSKRRAVGRNLGSKYSQNPYKKKRVSSTKATGSSTPQHSLPEHIVESEVNQSSSNIILDIGMFQDVLNSVAQCSVCQGSLELLETGKTLGSASYLYLKCSDCVSGRKFWSVSGYSRSRKLSIGASEIPKRNTLVFTSVLAGRIMGVGWHKLFVYHSMMNIPGPLTSRNFGIVQADILLAAELVADESMLMARDNHRALRGIDASEQYVTTVSTFDGAYQQRSGKSGGGFARYAFAACIIAETGKVVSYGIACNSRAFCTRTNNRYRNKEIDCDEFETQKNIHKLVCPAEYADLSSVHLESAIAPKVVSDVLEKGVLFSAIVTDGDNKTHNVLEKANLYSHLPGSKIIERYECIAHVVKRLKSNLFKRQEKVLKDTRSAKAAESRKMTKQGKSQSEIKKALDPEFRGQLQRSSKPRGSWDADSCEVIKHLSVSMCGQVASYFRLAVQRNSGDVPAILNAIKAIPFHLSANDLNAEHNHQFCPFTSDSWCRYQSAKFNNESLPNHPNFLGDDATKIIMDLFDDFGYNTADFIDKVSTGLSSNHNESLHNLLFTMVPKTQAVGIDVMKLGSALSIIRYNDGFTGIERLCNKLDIETTDRMRHAFTFLDASRARQFLKIVPAQRMRYRKKQTRGRTQSKQKAKHGPGYAPGKYTGAKKTNAQSDLSSDDDIDDIQDPIATSASPVFPVCSDVESCNICKGTEQNRIVGIGIGLRMIDEEVDWVQCDGCDKWYHLLCLEIHDPEEIGDIWHCDQCK